MTRYTMSPTGESVEFAVLAAHEAAHVAGARYGAAVLIKADSEVKTHTADNLHSAMDWATDNTPAGCWWVIVAWGEVVGHDTIQMFTDGES